MIAAARRQMRMSWRQSSMLGLQCFRALATIHRIFVGRRVGIEAPDAGLLAAGNANHCVSHVWPAEHGQHVRPLVTGGLFPLRDHRRLINRQARENAPSPLGKFGRQIDVLSEFRIVLRGVHHDATPLMSEIGSATEFVAWL
jgi:hypothetical protein